MNPVQERMLLALVLGLAAAAGNVLGGFFVVRGGWSRRYLTYFLAVGAGFMLAASILEILPEAIRLLGDSALVFVLIGYFVVHFFEHTLAPHFHFGEETHPEEMKLRHAAPSAILGLAIHTFFDGVAIASGFLVSSWLGGVIFLAVVLHKLPEGFTVSSLVLAGGGTRRNALLSSGVLGVATILGVILTGLLQAQVSYMLAISAGVTLYVAATDLMPEANREPGARISILVFLGVALLFVLHRFFHVH